MIRIIGTRHPLQFWTEAKRNGRSLEAKKEAVEEFQSYLKARTTSFKADSIAEELSEEVLGRNGPGASSVAKEVAKELGISHIFCDPNTDERRVLGVLDDEALLAHALAKQAETKQPFVRVYEEELIKNAMLKEPFWVDRLKGREPTEKSTIFVCGSSHVDSFMARLEEENIEVSIVCGDWAETT